MLEKNTFWDLATAEVYRWTDREVAIKNIIGGMEKPLPPTFVLCRFERQTVNASVFATNTLNNLLENLDDEFGDPEQITEPTDAMDEAAAVFIKAVLEEYSVWRCNKVTWVDTIDVSLWLEDHAAEGEIYGMQKRYAKFPAGAKL